MSVAIRLTFRAFLRSLGGPPGDNRSEQGDRNENRCATDSDEIETGQGPRAEYADQQRDAGDQVHRRQAQRGVVAGYPCAITAHRRRSADADELIAPESPFRGRPVNRDDQGGQKGKGDGDKTCQDQALGFH